MPRRLDVYPLTLAFIDWKGVDVGNMKGVAKWFNDSKDLGFVSPSEGGEDGFVHHSEVQMNGFAFPVMYVSKRQRNLKRLPDQGKSGGKVSTN
jgi:hypothetical protein